MTLIPAAVYLSIISSARASSSGKYLVGPVQLREQLFLAAPASGFPSFDTALLSHVPGACADAEPVANAISKLARSNRIICFLHLTGIGVVAREAAMAAFAKQRRALPEVQPQSYASLKMIAAPLPSAASTIMSHPRSALGRGYTLGFYRGPPIGNRLGLPFPRRPG
jgi:hypothetical protein